MLNRYRALAPLRRAVRQLAVDHHLPTELRARLVLSLSAVARHELQAGRPLTLGSAYVPGRDGEHAALLAITLKSPKSPGTLPLADLPLPAQPISDYAATWHVPIPAAVRWKNATGSPPSHQAPHLTETDAIEEELGAALACADALAAEHRRLKHELAETNSGVLALYVQLEERDEQLRTAHGQVLRELENALRPRPLTIEGLELAVHYEPAGADTPTGGDLYDWFPLPDGTVHITVVDAVGHGVKSTRCAVNVTHAVRTLALEGHPLQSIVARTDEILMAFDRELMATVLLARLNPATGELFLANGSHPPALLVRTDGTAEYLELRGRGIGFPKAGSEKLRHAFLDPGDLLILYTDGLTESRRDSMEGEARLVASARRLLKMPTAELPSAIAKEMHTVILHSDDTLALAIRIAPTGSEADRAGHRDPGWIRVHSSARDDG
ncbi:PP2C family protein-serine/threonine phosphatase [Streptomyces sp. H34-S4]|uniref:PP2C family protein-serine/threonine phosphatase n=1 Tax=Streptomyces sp. H34-S4 TaxID=2996463 RepID=UPI00226EC2F7|nr:PP2C family protein-serine/threonine phosphatase [Streptomyces sp. H34-S4]MCY0939376.1 PP2C family protein-serine/threonine phosphatase [Streptomyces sp. H34-S4]